jgi:hypothetical protein
VSSHGAQFNIELQAHARMAECAIALHFGLDPRAALHWSDYCDAGFDLRAFGVRWDNKQTDRGRNLIWPINKRHIYQTKEFDVLGLVRGPVDERIFIMVGFTNKPMFWHEHKVADDAHALDAGTWYMPEAELWDL